jgi:hypothetical protein
MFIWSLLRARQVNNNLFSLPELAGAAPWPLPVRIPEESIAESRASERLPSTRKLPDFPDSRFSMDGEINEPFLTLIWVHFVMFARLRQRWQIYSLCSVR